MTKRCVYLSGIIVILTILYSRKKHKSQKELAFIHIPKNAGTTIESLGMQNNIKWGRNMLENDYQVTETKSSKVFYNWHVPPRYLKQYNPYEKYDTFCVVRNPTSRILSEYKWFHNYNKEKDNANDLNNWLERVLTKNNIYFTGGVDRIGLMDGHLFPQYFFIYDENGNQTCNYILKMENLTFEFNELMKKYNYNLRLSNTDYRNKSIDFEITEKDINKENLKLINELYYIDFFIYKNL